VQVLEFEFSGEPLDRQTDHQRPMNNPSQQIPDLDLGFGIQR
jgi:hypothetical protein